MLLIIIAIILIIILIVINKKSSYLNNNTIPNEPINEHNKYVANGYIMTQTELKFYRELKKVTDKLELTIFAQVGLERIINVIDHNTSDRNKIKSRSIDFAIVNNKNCKIVCCIELDDFTHNREKAKKIDNFKDELFKQVKIPLYRIKVNNYYNLSELENIIKESLQPPTLIANN